MYNIANNLVIPNKGWSRDLSWASNCTSLEWGAGRSEEHETRWNWNYSIEGLL